MNRDIKFRAWDKKMNKIITDAMEIANIGLGEGSLILNKRVQAGNELLWTQFTGLQDINGKDIYEGDIIETSYGKVGTIVYYQRSASFIINDPDHFNEQLWHDAYNSKIIGNIYENPELLTTKQ